MRSRLFRSCALMFVAAGMGCARAGQRSSEPSVEAQAVSGELGPAYLEWTGKFRSTQQQSLGIEPRGLNIASGTVVLTAPDERRMRVVMSLSGPRDESGQLHWAIAPGACRSGSIPLMPVNTFPDLRMSNGHGELDVMISIPFPTGGTYHVNIYGGEVTDESGVMTCAELKLGRRKVDM